jgi:hypothetical protein
MPANALSSHEHDKAQPKPPVLRLAVVGHTNTGKTSLLRTLTRDPGFGHVQDSPGTTRHVEGARLLVDGRTAVELFDTPGMEDGMALLDYLDQLSPPSERIDGPDRIRRFLDSPESKRRFEQEARVLHKLLDSHALLLQDLKDDIAHQREVRRTDANRLIAELLIDVAAWHLSSEPDEASLKRTTETLRRTVRAREELCVKALLKRYNFKTSDFPSHTLPLEGERWGMDLFHPQALKDMGIQVGKGMAAGAMAGATVDVFTAGLSLGAAALLGAAAGGLWQGANRVGKRVVGRLKGFQELSVDDGVLRLLVLRQMALVRALEQRGHAAQGLIQIDADMDALRKGSLPDEVDEARSQPQWSTLADDYASSPRRTHAIQSLAGKLAHF